MIFFKVTALGCKVNSYEAQAISQTLTNAGLAKWTGNDKVGLCVIHSCCITAEAARKTRQLTRRIHKLHPEAAILLCGCYAAAYPKEAAKLPGVQYIATSDSDLAKLLRRVASELSRAGRASAKSQSSDDKTLLADDTTASHINIRASQTKKVKDNHCKAATDREVWAISQHEAESTLPPAANLDKISDFDTRSRAAVKLQDGCDRFCSYCIIPHLRNKLHSRCETEIIKEINAFLDNGYREIVLCGINLGAYGYKSVKKRPLRSPSQHFNEILAKISAHVANNARLRISSLDPSDIYPELAETIAKNSNICPHLHLSLQSGSDNILKAMERNYNSARFAESVSILRQNLDKPALTTDIIVGFPGESDSDFDQTMILAQKSLFSRMHIFPFSPREGTKAAGMKTPRPRPEIVKTRIASLNKLAKSCENEYKSTLNGQRAEVLIEGVNNDTAWGYCQRYLRMTISANSGDKEILGQIIDTKYEF